MAMQDYFTGAFTKGDEQDRQNSAAITEQDMIDAVYCLRFDRRERYVFFEKGMFGEVAWDILLELYSYSCGTRLVPIENLECARESSTYISWLSLLKEDGLINITGRGPISSRSRANLTSYGREKIEEYVKNCLNRLVVNIN